MTEGRGLRSIPANVFENIFGCKYPKSLVCMYFIVRVFVIVFFLVFGASCAKNSLYYFIWHQFPIRLLVYITVSELIFRQTDAQCMPLGQTSQVHPCIHVSISFQG